MWTQKIKEKKIKSETFRAQMWWPNQFDVCIVCEFVIFAAMDSAQKQIKHFSMSHQIVLFYFHPIILLFFLFTLFP